VIAQRASAWRLAAYGSLGMPLAMAALPIYVHVPKFYADTMGLSLASVGGLLLAARAFDAVQDPLLGWWSDRRRACPGGRWMFVAVGAPLLALGMVGLFDPPVRDPAALGFWLIASLLLVYTAFSLVTVSYQAYGAEISDDRTERTRVTAWREGFALAGVFVAAVLPEVLRREIGDREGFALFARLFLPLVLVATLLAIVHSPPARPAPRAPSPGLRSLALPFRNRGFRSLAVVFAFNGIAAAIPATLVLFFIESVVRRPDLTALFLSAYFAAAALGLPGWVWLSRRLGKARAWLCGMALSIVALVWAFFLGPGDAAAFLAICAMSGLGLGADLALPPSLLADVIDADEARGAGRHEGAYFGLWSLITKMNLALAAGIALPLLAAWGFRSGSGNDAAALLALAAVYALVPCALKALAAATLTLNRGEFP
jgi:Na+/melibiose symporter-like transporter